MINKDLFKNIKGRRIYLFWLDEETGEITDVTSRSDVRHIVLCKDCKYWKETDAIDEYNICDVHAMLTHQGDFCSWAQKGKKND